MAHDPINRVLTMAGAPQSVLVRVGLKENLVAPLRV